MDHSVKRKKNHISFGHDLGRSSLVAVKYSEGTLVLMYPENWETLSNVLPYTAGLHLSNISREFRVRNNSVYLDADFAIFLGNGYIKALDYPRGIILQRYDNAVQAVA